MPLQNFTVRGLTARALVHRSARCMVPRPIGPVTAVSLHVPANGAAVSVPNASKRWFGAGSTVMPSRWYAG